MISLGRELGKKWKVEQNDDMAGIHSLEADATQSCPSTFGINYGLFYTYCFIYKTEIKS